MSNISELVSSLRKMADEIAQAGHNGWGNTATTAADMLEQMEKGEPVAIAEVASGPLGNRLIRAILSAQKGVE